LPTDLERCHGHSEDIGFANVQKHGGPTFFNRRDERIFMNKDQVKGRVEQAKGNIKETTGNVVGNVKLQTEGTVDKVAGKVQANYGDAKEKVKRAIDKI
jgi:uncharacterized protein YjbJ (UPF0337 family)